MFLLIRISSGIQSSISNLKVLLWTHEVNSLTCFHPALPVSCGCGKWQVKLLPNSASLSLGSFAFPFPTRKYLTSEILSYNSIWKKAMSHKWLLRNTIRFFSCNECWKGNVLLVPTIPASYSPKMWIGCWAKSFFEARQIPVALIKDKKDTYCSTLRVYNVIIVLWEKKTILNTVTIPCFLGAGKTRK